MLDILIIGDTRCGKGYVAERLSKFYGIGEVASGENCSIAGLIGGLQQIGRQWFVTWGIIPLNHGRLVVIDEASSMHEEDFARLSRIRSEGIAEISKIVKESTNANTRLVWLSNPRSGRPIMSFNSGVEAIKELVGNNEDISRFDFAVTVAENEVDSEVINAPVMDDLSDHLKYRSDLAKSLILWIWSRAPDQIVFTDAATQDILEQSVDLGRRYSAAIPLVQSENIRMKLAKISAAVAGRLFSSNRAGDKLVVKRQHVKCAVNLLDTFYQKPSMAYDTYSEAAISHELSEEQKNAIRESFDSLGKDKQNVLQGLVEVQRISAESLSDYLSGDLITAKEIISHLVKQRCLSRVERGGWYYKNPPFTIFLRSLRREQKSTRKRRGSGQHG